MPDCFKCSLAFNRNNIVYGVGSYPNQIMIVGEAPGYYEDKTGVPFCGKSGVLLKHYLRQEGLDKSYLTNIVKCRPYLGSKITEEDITICTKYFLIKELKAVRPKFIITLGNTATSFFLKNATISKVSGNIYKYYNVYILPIYHPSYILRNNMEDVFEKHIKQINQYIKHL